MRRRTGAPEGPTRIIRYPDKHGRISALAALTVSPKRQHLGCLSASSRTIQGRGCGGLPPCAVAASARPCHPPLGPQCYSSRAGHRGGMPNPPTAPSRGVPGVCLRAQSDKTALERLKSPYCQQHGARPGRPPPEPRSEPPPGASAPSQTPLVHSQFQTAISTVNIHSLFLQSSINARILLPSTAHMVRCHDGTPVPACNI